ncbi:hypothetical protein C8T65DRAFT_586450, partial [Cerioporus squamosus]
MFKPTQRAASRAGSTPPTAPTPTSARTTTPATATGPMTRRSTAKRPATQPQAFAEAEKDLPDVDAAIRFLQQKALIPEGDTAVTEAALVTGLLHFALVSPSHDLARKGLIAFAYLARELFAKNTAHTIAQTVAERAEEQLTLRLDEHTTRIETQMEEVMGELAAARKELGESAGRLKDACDWAGQAEAALTAARVELEAAGSSRPAMGASHAPATTLTLEAAPARTRRAVNLADLLRRQVLVRGATLDSPSGQRPSDADVLKRAHDALDALAAAGLTPPKDGVIESAKILSHGDIVFVASSAAMAKWLGGPNVATVFSRKIDLKAHVIE